MNKFKLFSIFSFTLLFIFSCSSDDDTNENGNNNVNVKPTSYTVNEVGSNTFTVNFQYNGNLISEINTSFGNNITYNYNGDELSSFTTMRNGQSEITNLTYTNGRLTESRNDDNSEIITYTYNSAGEVNQIVYNDSGFTETTTYQYDSSGNVRESEDDFETIRYSYDDKNNPFRNVFPQLDAEVAWEWYGSLVNNQTQVESKDLNGSNFTTEYTYEYDYNNDNYPTERRQIETDGSVSETVTYTY